MMVENDLPLIVHKRDTDNNYYLQSQVLARLLTYLVSGSLILPMAMHSPTLRTLPCFLCWLGMFLLQMPTQLIPHFY